MQREQKPKASAGQEGWGEHCTTLKSGLKRHPWMVEWQHQSSKFGQLPSVAGHKDWEFGAGSGRAEAEAGMAPLPSLSHQWHERGCQELRRKRLPLHPPSSGKPTSQGCL